MNSNAITTAPKGRIKIAQGKARCAGALGDVSQNATSPEGANKRNVLPQGAPIVGRVSPHGVPLPVVPPHGAIPDDFDHALFNQRGDLVKRLEEWPFVVEIFYDDVGGPRLVRGTPPLLKKGMLVEEKGETTPRGDTRPTS